MMTQVCPSCSAPVDEDSARCPACGEVLDPFQTLGQPQFHGNIAPPAPPRSAPKPRPEPAAEPAEPIAETPAPAPPPRRVKPKPKPAPPAPVAPAPAAPAPPLPAYYPPASQYTPPPSPHPPASQGGGPGGLRGMLIKMLGGQAATGPGEVAPIPPPPAGYPYAAPPPSAPPQAYPPWGNPANAESWPRPQAPPPGYAPQAPQPGPSPPAGAFEPPAYDQGRGPAAVDDEDGKTRMMVGADVARLKVPATLFTLQILDRNGQWHPWSTIPAAGLKIGRSERNAQFPELNSMAARHFRLSYDGPRLSIEDLGALNGVFLRISRPMPLEDGSRFRVGGLVIDFRRAEPPPPVEALVGPDGEVFWSRDVHPLALLEFIGTDGKPGLRYPITSPDRTILGRESRPGRPVDVALPGDELVSGQHAAIRRDGDQFFLEDLGSRNGTYLQVRGHGAVEPGEVLLVGRVLLRVVDSSGR